VSDGLRVLRLWSRVIRLDRRVLRLDGGRAGVDILVLVESRPIVRFPSVEGSDDD
jgi:hypothetical protein